jgi:hypothetical protein
MPLFGLKKLIVLGAQSAVDQATAITALNVLIAAQIVIAESGAGGKNDSSVACVGYSTGVAAGPIFICSVVVSYVTT